jgi:hypothetical protein
VVDIWYPQTLEDKTDVTIRIPDVISFGVAWRPADTWLFSLDVNYIEYSVLNSPRNVPQGGSLIRSGGIDINDLDQRPEYYDSDFRTNPNPITEPISDGTTFHFGAEKSFFFDSGFLRTLALRGGAFTIVDHDGIVATDKDEVVWTVGLGSTWGKNELGAKVFQMDLGASIADDATNIVLSGIFRF